MAPSTSLVSALGGARLKLPSPSPACATPHPRSTQRQIYDITASPIVESVMNGFNGTIFAYGQTGAGKSFTMEGVPTDADLRVRPGPRVGVPASARPATHAPYRTPAPLPHPQGIIPNSFQHIFDAIGLEADKKKQFLVRASYLEIYNEEIRDLLSKNPKSKHDLREDADRGVFVPGLTSLVVKTMEEIDDIRKVRRGAELGCRLRHQCSRREAVPRAPFRTCRRRASVTAVWGPPR